MHLIIGLKFTVYSEVLSDFTTDGRTDLQVAITNDNGYITALTIYTTVKQFANWCAHTDKNTDETNYVIVNLITSSSATPASLM